MTKLKRIPVELSLDYVTGRDEPARGIYRNFPVEPKHVDELLIAIRSDEAPLGEPPYDVTRYGRPQVHLVGTARA
jgi:hypothetical protein